MCSFHKVKKLNLKIMNVRFILKADIRLYPLNWYFRPYQIIKLIDIGLG